jgi:CMP-N,N'-diacetyllegionaminic acid synthase
VRPINSPFVAVIPARGGSKRLPGKNLLPLAGKPLICHSIDAARGCKFVGDVYVSTEDGKIAETASKAGAKVIDRPSSLAGDEATSRDVVLHALDVLDEAGCEYELFALLQPTSPLRTASHLSECIASFLGGNYGCGISICESEHHPSKMLVLDSNGTLKPLTRADELERPQQSLPKVYRQNGAIYLMRKRDFRERAQGFYLPPAMPFVMQQEDSIDIDTALDFELASVLMEARR